MRVRVAGAAPVIVGAVEPVIERAERERERALAERIDLEMLEKDRVETLLVPARSSRSSGAQVGGRRAAGDVPSAL